MSTEREFPINTYEQVGDGGVFISTFLGMGRNPTTDGWAIYQVGRDIDPIPTAKRAWYAKGGSWQFHGFGHGGVAGALKAAKIAATERFGITKWRRNGMGDYVDANAGHKPLQCEVDAKAKRAASRVSA